MTLDEAIIRFKNKAIARRTKAEHSLVERAIAINRCAEEYEQLVSWLEELKVYRESNGISENVYRIGYKFGYNRALVDLTINNDCTGTTLNGTTEVK